MMPAIKRGTRTIVDSRHVGPRHYEWLMTCGHTITVQQRPRDGQRTAVCEACRGGAAHPERSTGRWKSGERQSKARNE